MILALCGKLVAKPYLELDCSVRDISGLVQDIFRSGLKGRTTSAIGESRAKDLPEDQNRVRTGSASDPRVCSRQSLIPTSGHDRLRDQTNVRIHDCRACNRPHI